MAGLVTLTAGAVQARKVQVGYCVGLKGLETAKAAGFDYVELSTTEITALSDADFEAAVAHAKEVGMPTPNANLFLPGTIKLTGPSPPIRSSNWPMSGRRSTGCRSWA